MVYLNDVVQFNENHNWRGCIGIVVRISAGKIMVCVPIPSNDGKTGSAYTFCKETEIERIGKAVLA